jgi:hypothetical protein
MLVVFLVWGKGWFVMFFLVKRRARFKGGIKIKSCSFNVFVFLIYVGAIGT